jgi:hypothetical protein
MKQILIIALSIWLAQSCANSVRFEVPATQENFAQSVTWNNKVDILFVIDNTVSMEKMRQSLYTNMSSLITSLNQMKMDYRVGSTSTTMASWYPGSGRLHGSPVYITQNSPGFDAAMYEKIIMNNDGSSVERGMDAVVSLSSATYQSGEGQGFLRSDALLSIIVVTNEDDKSTQMSSTTGNNSQYYKTFFDKLKPSLSTGERGWMLNFVGITSLADPCQTSDIGSYKEVGVRLMELANYSRGRVESVCSGNLGGSLSNIRARIVQRLSDYKLGRVPNVSSIRVYVNGALVPQDATNGWVYVSDLNLVRFNGTSLPNSDASIRVDFDPAGSD